MIPMCDHKKQPYRFSMTAASLAIDEFIILANRLIKVDFDYERLSYQDINKERAITGKRKFSEQLLRLKQMSKEEILFLLETNTSNQRLLVFLASVRLYRFLREFVVEVILQKIAVHDYQLSERDMNSFMYDKSVDHNEIMNLSEQTKEKVKQVILKLLEQAGLIESVSIKKIRIPFLDCQMQHLLDIMDRKYLLNI